MNITYGEFLDRLAYADFRENMQEGMEFNAWLSSSRSEADVPWMDAGEWNGLTGRLAQIAKEDKASLEQDETAEVLDFSSWKYFRSGFADESHTAGTSLEAAFGEHREKVQEESLDKYVGVFGNIGYVLLAFSLLIALLNKPLKSLMHGVE